MPKSKAENKRLHREWYLKNKEKVAEKQRKKRQARRAWFETEILSKLKCEECNENHPACLDFHHKDPSEKDGMVGDMLHQNVSIAKIMLEISKCKVLCSNCHRKHHWLEK